MPSNGELVGRDAFLGPVKRRYRTLGVPSFGKVRIQSLTEREKSDYETAVLIVRGDKVKPSQKRLEDSKRRLLVLCIVDAEGNRLMTEADMTALEKMDGAAAQVIFDACMEHCGFQSEDIEELVKNSVEIPEGDTVTSSPECLASGT